MSLTKPLPQYHRFFPFLLISLAMLPTACSYTEARTLEHGENEDPFNQINTALVKNSKIQQFFVQEISRDAFSNRSFQRNKAIAAAEQPREKIHPMLKKTLASRAANETALLVINFRDEVKIPRFPKLVTTEPYNSAVNTNVRTRAQQLIQEIKGRRSAAYQRFTQELSANYNATVLETFWLTNAVLVKMPLGAVTALAQRQDVMYVQPNNAGEKPPQNTNNNDDVDDGRTRIVSDPYFNLSLTQGWIGLLDTGMRFTHTQFNNPSHIDFRRDCVNGGADCNTGSELNPNDDCWNHGTSSGAIITANANQGDAYRGVTGITLDSFKVYPTSFDPNTGACNGGLDTAAAVRGFENAIASGDGVIVAEMQGNGDETSIISTAADNAFDAGAVIIAANGNNGPDSSTVNSPANAHKVIGVGAFDVQTQTQYESQSRGPTQDNRYKPDIQAPTNTETASNASDTALHIFSGTSGATPYAAGAAALLRNWLIGSNSSIDPGQVYAHLILSGQQPSPFNNTSGAGKLRLPIDDWIWWGKVSVSNETTIDIPLNISGATLNNFDGALWWPETASQQHNDIDLSLIDPSGVERSSSTSVPSVFERARVAGSVPSGTWKLRIRGYSVTGSQTVYWAAKVRLY
jgi:hypothetical protein